MMAVLEFWVTVMPPSGMPQLLLSVPVGHAILRVVKAFWTAMTEPWRGMLSALGRMMSTTVPVAFAAAELCAETAAIAPKRAAREVLVYIIGLFGVEVNECFGGLDESECEASASFGHVGKSLRSRTPVK